jgi:hypothetical protein
MAATVASLTVALAQDKGAPLPGAPQAKGRGFGRGGKKGPAGPLPRLSDGKPDITGVWNGFGGSGQDAPDMLPWAAKVVADHRAAGGAEDFEARCLPGGPPRAAPYHTSFFATPKLVVMLFEGNTHMYRQFFVDGSSHPKDLKPTFYGDSRAHWDGDTLIVETTNFNGRSVYRNANPETLKITERFTRTASNKLRWSVTMEDPKTWTKPWTFSMPLTMNDAEPIQLYECHEGNYGLRNILSAARAEERALSNATKP